MKLNKLALIFSIFIFSFSLVRAQESIFDSNTGLPNGIEEQISITVIPSVPQPGEQVSITVESYSTNLNNADFSWRINGTEQSAGKGLKQFIFSAPKSGEVANVNLTMLKETGGTITRSFEFAPADIDLIYEAKTYTHPYYKGKALYTSESEIRVIALPNFIENGVQKNSNNLTYKWSINGTVDQANSGYGKKTYTYKGSLIQRPLNVSVEVSAENSSLKGKENIYIEPENVDLVIYENNPILGVIFEKAVIGNFLLNKPEIELQVIPYNFSTSRKESPEVTYSWLMNGEPFVSNQSTNSVVLRNESGEEGLASINVNSEHVNNILQVARTGINLLFEAHNATPEEDFQF